MMDREHVRDLQPVSGAAYGLAGAGAVALIVGLAAFTAPRPADALPAYAKQTGLACGRCHVNPAGGGPRTAFGNAFAANGHKLPAAAGAGKKSARGGAPSPSTTAPTPSVSGSFLTDSDYAQAQAWSLRHPYYTHFLYAPDDFTSP